MKKIHVTLIAGLLALAALGGMFAATRTASLGAAARRSSDTALAARTKQLDAYAASLRRALAHRPPALPQVPVAGAPGVGQAAAPLVIYHRPPPIVVVKHRPHGDGGFEPGDGSVGDD